MNDTYDLLRIIAGERGSLADADRETIRQGAEELERAYRQWTLTSLQLIEAQQQVIAQNERIIELQRGQAQSAPPKWTMGTGWVTMPMLPQKPLELG